ncbi:MAG TPA: hypothetical protein VEA39_06950 [Methylophilaceae bacterium]|nr:hypothetical protein [Methylophilaceae bacterium]
MSQGALKYLPYARLAARLLVFLWFFLGGISHFLIPDVFVRIVPPFIPYPEYVVYLSGLFELAGALAIWHQRLRSYVGIGLILLTLCVTPANIYMWMHPELFPYIPLWALAIRLPLQLLLIWVIWYATRKE